MKQEQVVGMKIVKLNKKKFIFFYFCYLLSNIQTLIRTQF